MPDTLPYFVNLQLAAESAFDDAMVLSFQSVVPSALSWNEQLGLHVGIDAIARCIVAAFVDAKPNIASDINSDPNCILVVVTCKQPLYHITYRIFCIVNNTLLIGM